MLRILGLAAFGVAALTGHIAAEPVAVETGRVPLTAAQLASIVDGCCPKLPPDGGRRLLASRERWGRVERGVIRR